MAIVDAPREMFDQPEYRVEGPLKVTGAARYTADVRLPGMLWLAYTRSPLPHARIVSIDTSAAKAVPGVHAVLTGADIGFVGLGRQLQDWPVLAIDRVRMIGDRVAAVAAESKAAAEEAARLVEVEYEELPLVTLENALDPDAPVLHPDPESYKFLGPKRPQTSHPNVHGHAVIQKSETGESIEDVFARADHVFEHTFTVAREFQGFHRAARVRRSGSTRTIASTSPTRTRRRRSSAGSLRRGWASRPTGSSSTPRSSAAISAARASRSTSTPATSWRKRPAGRSRR